MMKNQVKEIVYESPIVEVIEVEVEKGFALSARGMESPTESDEISW